MVAEVVPLKQGLKHTNRTIRKSEYKVAEVVPLKQGLKQFANGKSWNQLTCCRGSSIKTRIETLAR